ncbi:MAG: asparagine synthase (glutamine-hydrolyzing) [Methanomicrobiaceae archaeon]|nr:asparagine synthase (glutamine-hydrolyzing) [Methanomicrobiaceae archaeon]
MCGIAGIYSYKGGADPAILGRMSDAIAHRGPDGSGIYCSHNAAVAHRRLSIIDLSDAAAQPMPNEDETLILVFNGEIYNYRELKAELEESGHRFRSAADSEVILHSYEEWGEKCLERFNGMWAFVILDLNRNTFFCARDRFGIKPFYYMETAEGFYFASEIKAFHEAGLCCPAPDKENLLRYLAWGVLDTSEGTMFEGVKQLPPASFMTTGENGCSRPVKYWDFSMSSLPVSPEDLDGDLAAEKLKELLYDSVRLRLRSDVPVGTCLSGGIDSSTIVAIINNLIRKEGKGSVGERQNTFSACFSDKRYDESEYMDEVIAVTGVSAHKISPSTTDLKNDLERLIYMQDEPFYNISVYAQYRVMQLASHDVKVVLDGQGADEQLAGYLGYQAAYFRSLKSLPVTLLKEIFASIKIHHGFFISAPGQLLARRKRRSFIRGVIPPASRYSGTLDDVLKNEITNSNLQALLHYEDRNSMAFSIESRVPFLDYRLVEYIASLPLDQKIRHGITKYILRKAIAGLVPERIRCRMDKMGFVTPEEVWMKDELSDLAVLVFSSESFMKREYWDGELVKKSYLDFKSGRGSYSPEFWRILCAELWLRIFFDKMRSNF